MSPPMKRSKHPMKRWIQQLRQLGRQLGWPFGRSPRFSPRRQTILWAQVLGLAALQGAISLTWVVYALYLPQLLAQFGFVPEIGIGLLLAENILGIVMEPLMGSFSDRSRQWFGSRFPMIVLGVLLAAGLFLSIPAIALFANLPGGNPHTALRWVLLVLVVGWSLAMTIFRSPAMAMLGHYAMAPQLPRAASLLSFAMLLVGLSSTLAQQTILSWGPLATFSLGSGVLIAAVILLQRLQPDARVSLGAVHAQLQQSLISVPQLGLIFGAGLGVALGTTLLRQLLDRATPIPGISFVVVFAFAQMVMIFPAGWLAMRWGNAIMMSTGLGAIALLMVLFPLTAGTFGAVIMVLLLGIAFSFVLNGTLPFALSLVPSTQVGLGTGLFFSGGALANTLMGTVNNYWGAISPSTAAVTGAIAFLGAAGCIALAPRPRALSI